MSETLSEQEVNDFEKAFAEMMPGTSAHSIVKLMSASHRALQQAQVALQQSQAELQHRLAVLTTGLQNIYAILTGRECAPTVALGMATSVVGQLKAQLAATRGTWTTETPTKAGWYWWRNGGLILAVELVRNVRGNLIEEHGDLCDEDLIGAEWSGPLAAPEERGE